MAYTDHYTLLGVKKDSDKKEIQSAYRRLARKYHPDRNKENGAEEMFKSINEAYSTLSDDESRRLYDRYGDDWQRVRDHSRDSEGEYGGPWQEGDFTSWAEEMRQGSEYHSNDFFSSIFGKPNHREFHQFRQQYYNDSAMRNNDVEAYLDITLEELLSDESKTLSWRNSGSNGGGDVTTISLKIPRGIKNGSTIRLSGKGDLDEFSGIRGDLLLHLRIAEHSRFSVEGFDLRTTVQIFPWEAALGTKVEVDTLTGKILLSVPQGSDSGRIMKVKGLGLPQKGDSSGDLYVTLQIIVPTDLTEEERKLFEQLEKTASSRKRERKQQK